MSHNVASQTYNPILYRLIDPFSGVVDPPWIDSIPLTSLWDVGEHQRHPRKLLVNQNESYWSHDVECDHLSTHCNNSVMQDEEGVSLFRVFVLSN